MWWRIGALLAGVIVGSFLTTVIERLPRKEQFLRGRSRCAQCGMRLTPRDLIPLFSFLTSRGRCRHCGAPIPWWHLAVEVATPVLFLFSVTLSPNPSLVDQLSTWVLLVLLLALTVIDLHTLLLPDSLVVATAVVGVLRSLALQHPPFPDAVLGGSVGLFLLGLLALLPWRRAIHDADDAPTTAMGLGDAKLAGAMGLTLGLQGLLIALAVAFVSGGLVAGLLVLSKRATLKSRVPFGPFLAGATALLLLVPQLSEMFFRLAGVSR